MIRAIQNSRFVRGLWGFLCLYMLNCSIDTPISPTDYPSNHLGFNEQESVMEVILEHILGFDTAVPDYDSDDSEKETPQKKSFSIPVFFIPILSLLFKSEQILKKSEFSWFLINQPRNPFFEIHSPPPDFCLV
ncbi:hypothetical protein [Arundinibacter roseus]|uniref:Uncharacterized protein n=1 Tax=Arundinibacter roseus TaxID=2070510 RepID=A0A4V2X908_9BACT|nr:hypothetical protein [Arundinibacter roseus]TDB61815.1 hypothetical protein EZE20_18895 [Arundinibacter roseus]